MRRPGTGQPQYLILYDYPNERRGGEVITGGTVAYWDGNDVVPVVELNSARQPVNQSVIAQGASVEVPPYRPLTPAHLELARRLHGRAPVVRTHDPRAQVRALDCPGHRAVTLPVFNRFPDPIETVIETTVNGRHVRLPERGTLKLPSRSTLMMPVDYELRRGVVISQATLQLLSYRVGRDWLALELYSPAGGDLVVSLPARVTSARVGAKAVQVEQSRLPSRAVRARLLVPGGEHEVTLRWSAR